LLKDTSKIKNSQSTLSKSEIRYDMIVKAAGLGTWEWNYKTNEIIYNDIWFNILGYANIIEHIEDTSFWYEIIHPDDLETSEKAINKHIIGKTEFYQCEIRLKHKNGKYIWVQDTGKVVSWDNNGNPEILAGTHTNINKRKKNELLLSKYKDLLDKTNEAALIGTWEVDLLDNQLVWSSVTKHIHEVPKNFKPDIETAINFYKQGENRDRISRIFANSIANLVNFDDVFEIITAKGNSKWVRSLGIPIAKKKKCTRIYGIFQDVTSQQEGKIRIENLLGETKSQNERLLNFAHIVSHNLHSHSGNLTMLLQLLKTKETGINNKIFPLIEKAAFNLEETVVHLSEVVAMNSLTKEHIKKVQLREAVDKALINLNIKLNKAKIQVSISKGTSVKAIPAYLDSILINLLTNAHKYAKNSGQLEIIITGRKTKNKVLLSIQDNGLGIDLKKHGSKIFGMYKTFHGGKKSRGIGLFISKNQIETMGGRIEVTSTPNHGSIFTLEFNK